MGSCGLRSKEDAPFSGSWEIKEEEVLPEGKKRPSQSWGIKAQDLRLHRMAS